MLSQDQEKKATIKKKFSFSPCSSSAQRKRTAISSSKHNKQENKQASETSDDSLELYSKPLDPEFYINITTDGLRHMDYICHLNDDQVQNRTIERQLRPISGVKNRLKRNAHVYDEKLIEQSDLVKTLSKIRTIKRLDMSFNELSYYPKPLCDLLALETLNLANNKLKDSELPVDFDKYQNLIEIILDSNLFKAVPKSLINFKKLNRLSIRNNMISDFKNIENLHKLHYLVADNNEISRIDETFSNIDELELLHLKGNSISYIHPSLLKKNFNQLKQLNLSYNKLQHVPVELLKLPRIEILNLGNNLITKLPMLPVTFKRAIQMVLIDLSSNFITKFYEYLLSLASFIDLSSNKIQSLPSSAIKALNSDQLRIKILKLDDNPLEYPPIDVCVNGLKVIKQYFEEASSHVQLNHGFKFILIGDSGSGKTNLAYALEDFHEQATVAEIINEKADDNNDNENSADTQIISKFVEVHDLFSKVDTEKMNKILKKALINGSFTGNQNKEIHKSDLVTTMPISIFDINGSSDRFGHLYHFFIDRRSLIMICIDITTFDESMGSNIKRKND